MKKNLFLVAAVALMALVSCNKEELGNNTNGVVFVAELEQEASTKTQLGDKGETGRKALWVKGDKISINGTEFSAVSDGEVAEFTTTAEFTEADVYRAVYPASSYYSNTHVLIPETQDGTFANASIAVAESNTNTLVFNNFSSILKFQVPTACETVSFESNVSLNGRVKVDYADGNFTADYAGITSGANRQTITVKAEGGFVPDKDYYVAVRPYTHKLTVKIDGNLSKASEKTVTVERTKIHNLGVLPKAKLARDLAYDKKTVNHTLGNTFTAPKLTGITDGVTYKSSDTAVATIDAAGNVTVVGAEGTTIITASAPATENYLADEATYTLIVKKQERGLGFSEETVEHDLDDVFTAPELNGFDEGVTYSSLNPEVATVNEITGEVTINAKGETTITASATETANYKSGEASYKLIVKKYFNVYVCISDLNWSSVNMHQFTSAGDLTIWPGEPLSEKVTVNNKNYYKKKIEEDTTLSFTYNNGKASSNFKIDVKDVTVDNDIYYRLSARGAIAVDPNDVKTFGYAIYVFDQKSKNVAPNLYAWDDGNAWNTQYGGNFAGWPGVAFKDDCYYIPADSNNWKHYYYYEIPTALYGKSFKFIVNKSGKTSDLSVTNLNGDLYVGYWYDSASSNGFWTNTNLNTPITQ